MKPIVVTLNENGKIELTQNEFNEILNNVYQEGYTDGVNSIQSIPYSFPTIPWNLPTYKLITTCNTNNLNNNNL